MVGSVSGASSSSYISQLLGTSAAVPTAITLPTPTATPAPSAAPTGVTGSTIGNVSLSPLVLSLLQSGNSSDNSTNDLLGGSGDSNDPVLTVLLANSEATLYKAAYAGANQKALDSAITPPSVIPAPTIAPATSAITT